MIKSMTGYAKSNYIDENFNFDIEIKTINSRYLDFNIKMPYDLNFLEDSIKKLTKKYISRGRVDIYIRNLKKRFCEGKIIVDEEKAKEKFNALSNLRNLLNKNNIIEKIKMEDILSNDEILIYEYEDLNEDIVKTKILENLENTLQKVVETRKFEGENLYKDLEFNLNEIKTKLDSIKLNSENINEEIRIYLNDKISSLIDESVIDNDRLANEIVYYAERQDINEEITRLDSHIIHFKKELDNESMIGKKLDFIAQEMLREANTIGSKTSKINIIDLIIDIKTLIEKIKEQVQNVE